MTPDRVIFKYNKWNLDGNDAFMEVPLGKVVLVGVQHPAQELPVLWIEHSLSPHPEEDINTVDLQTFRIVGTGHKMIMPNEEYVGSCICANGLLVWHVYRTKS